LGDGTGEGAGLASNYVLKSTTATTTASIKARELGITEVVAADRQYDGTKDAKLTSVGTLTNLVKGENLILGADDAKFENQNVVGPQTVTATGYTLGDGTGQGAGLASNYVLKSTTATTTASITPATLTYTATAQTATAGEAITLAGALSGFVEGETVANATTGTLTWSTPGDTTQAGVYAINGGGLSATNYVFVQAEANALALTVNPAPSPTTAATPDTSLEVAGLLMGGASGGAGSATGSEFQLPTEPTAAGPGEGTEEEQEVAENESVGEGSLTVINQGVRVPKGLMF
jgi:YDG domain/MBG domain (YGX type)